MSDLSDPRVRLAFMRAAYLERPVDGHSDSHAKAVRDYVQGRIEIEELEARFDALLAKDPKALGELGDPMPRVPAPWPSDAPGAVVRYRPVRGQPPPSIANMSEIVKSAWLIAPGQLYEEP